jgi:DNA replicative helicase MCM subunit Mcm2 (Cdc46/Mcm family)
MYFSNSKSVSENLCIEAPILSRFDLIYVLTEDMVSNHQKTHQKEPFTYEASDIALFIANAKGVHARFSEESKKYLLNFYLTKRKSKSENLFSTRQLNSLIRLSLAEARCHFSNVVTTQHVKNVIEIWYLFFIVF